MNKNIVAIFIIVILASCSAAKKAQQQPVATVPVDTATLKVDSAKTMETIHEVLQKLNHIDYTTFTGRASVNYTAKDDSKSFDVKIQMQKDSLIWVSVQGPLGIEGARALITKDSVRIINKLNKQYISSSYTYLQDQLGIPLDLGTLQDLLIGNPVFIDETNSSYTKQGNELQVTSQSNVFKNLLTAMLPGYLPSMSKLDDVDTSRNRSATLTYSDYEASGNMQFPTKRNINVKYKTDIKIQLNYKSYTFNEALSTPFSVPKGYKTK